LFERIIGVVSGYSHDKARTMNPAIPVIGAIHDFTHGTLGSPRARAILPPLAGFLDERRIIDQDLHSFIRGPRETGNSSVKY